MSVQPNTVLTLIIIFTSSMLVMETWAWSVLQRISSGQIIGSSRQNLKLSRVLWIQLSLPDMNGKCLNPLKCLANKWNDTNAIKNVLEIYVNRFCIQSKSWLVAAWPGIDIPTSGMQWVVDPAQSIMGPAPPPPSSKAFTCNRILRLPHAFAF